MAHGSNGAIGTSRRGPAYARRFLFVCGCTLTVAGHLGGTDLKGLIISDEIGGQPIADVQIRASGANDATSNSLGMFTLQFPQKNAGETVRLLVGRKGYEVVNDLQLEIRLPDNAETGLIAILLCKDGDYEEMARRFYRVMCIREIEKTYKKRLREVEARQGQTADEELNELRERRRRAMATTDGIAEELAGRDVAGGSVLYGIAMRHFLDGKIAEAIEILNGRELQRIAAEPGPQGDKRDAEAVQLWLLKARLLTLELNFEEAYEAHREAIERAPQSFETNFAFARFAQDVDNYGTAEVLYEKCLELARREGDAVEVARALHNRGTFDSDRNRGDEARTADEEALEIRRELARKDPETYLPDVAMTLYSLGILDGEQNRNRAREAYEEALTIRRELARKNAEVHLPYMATILHNLAILDSEQNREEDARRGYEEALTIRRDLAQKNPEAYLPYVATTLNNLAILDGEQNREEEASREYEEALTIRRELAQRNPEAYLPYVATTLNNLGNLYSEQDRENEARKAYEEALKTYRDLAQQDPGAYLPYLAMALNNLGALQSEQNREEEARETYHEALKTYRELAQKQEPFLPYVAMTLSNLGNLESEQLVVCVKFCKKGGLVRVGKG